MFFVLSKTVAFLLMPSNLLVLLCAAGLVLMATRWRRAGRWLAGMSVVLLLAIGYLPVGRLLVNVLEDRFPRWDASRGAPDGIVVLGGAIRDIPGRPADEPTLSGEGARVMAIGRLARAYPDARIIFSSGDASLRANRRPEADQLPPLLDAMGVPRERVTLERRSRNTHENAIFSKELAQPKPGERWLVVTSAFHMPRAIGCFRRAGFDVEAYPVSWRTADGGTVRPQGVFSSGLSATDFAAHEWSGLVVYWLTGRTDALLPGPRT
ncbi:MAG: YdcF family protein [Pseudolabrys sp.]|nr:YdcF family protein [Pseudolabrys sp.]